MRVFNFTHNFNTQGEGDVIDLTRRIEEIVLESGIRDGVIHLFAPHATGAIVLSEHESNLIKDIISMLEDLVPSSKRYRHPVNSRSHLRSIVLGPSQTIPIINGKMTLGTWQSIFWIEVDTQPRLRNLIIQVVGE